MLGAVIVLAITIICTMWDRSEDKKDQRFREGVLCDVDRLRVEEINKLKAELERLRNG